jgi:hypothetical protein
MDRNLARSLRPILDDEIRCAPARGAHRVRSPPSASAIGPLAEADHRRIAANERSHV